MNNAQNIANLITIRNFLSLSIDNMYVKLSREDVKAIQQKIQLIDQTIVKDSLKLDVQNINVVKTFESTEDTKTVLEKFKNVQNTPSDFRKSTEEEFEDDGLIMPEPETKSYKIVKSKRVK